jgi:histidinol phosphatase-like PHP family hydrolase
MFRLAKECGCKFTFGSDAHDSSQHEFYGNAQILADILGLKETDILEICR